jgi:hypothetical protein
VKFWFFSNPKTPVQKCLPKMWYPYSRVKRILAHSSLAPCTVFATNCSRKSAKQNGNNPFIERISFLKYIIMNFLNTSVP